MSARNRLPVNSFSPGDGETITLNSDNAWTLRHNGTVTEYTGDTCPHGFEAWTEEHQSRAINEGGLLCSMISRDMVFPRGALCHVRMVLGKPFAYSRIPDKTDVKQQVSWTPILAAALGCCLLLCAAWYMFSS
jgi:hypothetical protein